MECMVLQQEAVVAQVRGVWRGLSCDGVVRANRQFPAKVQQVAIHWATPGTALRTDKQDRRQKRVRQETKPEAT